MPRLANSRETAVKTVCCLFYYKNHSAIILATKVLAIKQGQNYHSLKIWQTIHF